MILSSQPALGPADTHQPAARPPASFSLQGTPLVHPKGWKAGMRVKSLPKRGLSQAGSLPSPYPAPSGTRSRSPRWGEGQRGAEQPAAPLPFGIPRISRRGKARLARAGVKSEQGYPVMPGECRDSALPLPPTLGPSPVRAKHPPHTPQSHPKPHRRMLRPYADPAILPATRPYRRFGFHHNFQRCAHMTLIRDIAPVDSWFESS